MTRRRSPGPRRGRKPRDLRESATLARDVVVILRDAILIGLGVVLTVDTFVLEEGAVDPVRAATCAALLGLPIFLRTEERPGPPDPPAPSSPSALPELGPPREDPRA